MEMTVHCEGQVRYCHLVYSENEPPVGWKKRTCNYMVIDVRKGTVISASRDVWTPNGSDAELDVLCNAWNKDQTGADGESLIWKYWHN